MTVEDCSIVRMIGAVQLQVEVPDAGVAQLLHAPPDGGLGVAGRGGEVGVRRPAVRAERLEQGGVELAEFDVTVMDWLAQRFDTFGGKDLEEAETERARRRGRSRLSAARTEAQPAYPEWRVSRPGGRAGLRSR